jgi:hypothetical protein
MPPDDRLDLPRGARMALLAPDAVARRIAAMDDDRERRWMLRLPRDVRCSFVAQVVDAGGGRRAQERWLLLADEATRRSYVTEVLDGD